MVKEHNSDTVAIGKMEVKAGDPAQVASFSLRTVPPGTKASDLDFKVDAATRAKVIDGAVAALNESYVFPGTPPPTPSPLLKNSPPKSWPRKNSRQNELRYINLIRTKSCTAR
jgi:hypothetical protein